MDITGIASYRIGALDIGIFDIAYRYHVVDNEISVIYRYFGKIISNF